MRVFKFVAVFLIVTGLVYMLVIGLNFNVFKTVFSNQEALADGSEWVEKTYSLSGMAEFVSEHPNLVSVAMLSVDPESDNNLLFEADVHRAMGATGHFWILLAYAQAVNDGLLSADLPVEIADLDRYLVPGHEPNRHRESVRYLTKDRGFTEGVTTLDELVRLMVTRAHQPSADYLYHILGMEYIRGIVAHWLGSEADFPLPWSSFYIAATLSIPDHTVAIQEHQRRLFQESVITVYEQIQSGRFTVASLLPEDRKRDVKYTFFEERSIYRLLPTVKPIDMARTMLAIYTGTDITAAVQQIVLNHMRWPMDRTELLKDFTDIGAIYDSRIAVSNGLTFATSTYTGETFVSAIFFDQLPVGFWMHMSSNLINQDFQLRMKYDPAMFERTSILLGKKNDNQTN
jgi:hypothetical protein